MCSQHPSKVSQNFGILTHYLAIWSTSLMNRPLERVQVGRRPKNGGISFAVSQCDHGES